MSAHNFQSDTSRPIVKNPLLSAVAGSIDDFVNNTILLPAAEIPTPIEKPVAADLQSIDHLQRGNKLSKICYLTWVHISWMSFKTQTMSLHT